MKKLRKIVMTMALAMAMIVGGAVPALTAKAAFDSINGSATATTFDKYFVVQDATVLPSVSFTFGIESGTPVAITATTPEIKAGPEGATLNKTTVSFNSESATYNAVQAGDMLDLPAGYKYAKEQIIVDLSGVTFTQPGIYRWVVTESGSNAGVVNDNNTDRYIDVYVLVNKDTGELEIPKGGIISHPADDVPGTDGAKPNGMNTNSDPVGDEEGDDAGEGGEVNPSDITTWKPHGGSDSFVNIYANESNKITVSSATNGNQADKDKEFTYVVTIINPKDIFQQGSVEPQFDDSDPDVTIKGELTDAKTYVVTITMPSDETVDITNVPNGATVTVNVYTDDKNTSVESEGYVAKHEIDKNVPVDGSSATVTMGKDDHTIGWTLTKNVEVPTGIYVRILPFVLMIGAALLVFGVKIARSSKKSA